ncbi:hypothetical protein LGL08_12855 [Clostridium estertheticum]|uniref:hypothetical protein n=1 Tax=Clostridium estertheticum TaxID=238834 RepID=UPI001CF41DC8|nr:hypothetical protein [Clostridium estertheticum]MCB2306926.1 hypothetical protein [Clostridium estertheticum]MCB2345285.1 hypothetical protein [Clostridium estertheticum]MCB2350432.1 hypothetical protein [Clostridium estertheticum]WAG45175.1 hypothetical protein LL127_16755 [Clostridium estertheticum]
MLKKSFLKGISFVIIILLFIITLNSIFIIKTNHRAKLTQGLYTNTGDSFDVVLLGSSHMDALINPNVLWKQFGITSFDYSTGGQPIDVTYYLLKEVLKKHKDPIVVVDLYYLGSTDKFGDEGYIRTALDNVKFSVNKVKAILNTTPMDQWLNYFFPIFKYHDRWKELTDTDFNFDTDETYYRKGFNASHDVYGKENASNSETTKTVDLPPKTEEYLNKIITLSKKENFKLIFTNAPHDYSQTAGSKVWTAEPAKMFNKVAEISKANNIPFINYNKLTTDLGFNFKKDMANIGHLNIFGSEKATSYLGKYLKTNYKLTDHRNDETYKKWNSDYVLYSRSEKAIDITNETNIKNYIPLIKNKNYIIVASTNEDISKNEVLRNSLTLLGLKTFTKNSVGSNYLAIINDNKIQSETLSSAKLSKDFSLNKWTNFKITTQSVDEKIPSIALNGVENPDKHAGLNIIVYDKSLKKIIDTIYLDSTNVIKR